MKITEYLIDHRQLSERCQEKKAGKIGSAVTYIYDKCCAVGRVGDEDQRMALRKTVHNISVESKWE